MRVAVISDAVFPTPYPAGGHGLGAMVHQLAEGLRSRGHDVVLFAKPGSQFSGQLVAPEDAVGYSGEVALAREAMRQHRTSPFDVFFDHSHIHHLASQFPTLPVVNVYHDNFQQYQRCPVLLSEGQRALMPTAFAGAPIVHNALNPAHFPFNPQPKGYVFFCGAMSEIKQPMLAVEACARAGVHLVMAGQAVVGKMPFGDHDGVEYVGQLPPASRNTYMANARVFLQLGNVESFGLTTLEAGLCGTPVVAWAGGGNVDTVRNGVNGVFAVTLGKDTVGAVADAIDAAWYMDRAACRAWVAQRFRVDEQISAYEALLARCAMGRYWA